MPKKSKKSKSKRVSLGRKYKILKKVKEHHKKKAKAAKKAVGRPSGPKKAPGIPSQWPFKEEVLKEIRFHNDREEAKKQARKAALRESRQAADTNLERMKHEAESRSRDFAESGSGDAAAEAGARADADNTRKSFYKAFQKVVELSDVLIQVLDARDPQGCRCAEIERHLAKHHPNKKVILLLNKADLVPREPMQKWLRFLRAEYPALAFKCSTQKQARNLGQRPRRSARGGAGAKDAEVDAPSGSDCVGAGTLLQLLKNYARNRNMKQAITVGVIGLPNVGKSSLINSLLRTKAAAVGSTPGVTTNVQEVNLDKHVKLLDCPGIVFTSGNSALLNAVRVERLPDPREAVAEIVARVPKRQLMQGFKVPAFKTPDEFLERVAKGRGKLLKGGLADARAAAKLVIQDWNQGKVPFFTLPPEDERFGRDKVELVPGFAQDFDVEQVYKDEELSVIAKLGAMETDDSSYWMEARPSGMQEGSLDDGAGGDDGTAGDTDGSGSDAEDMDEGEAGGGASAAAEASQAHKQNKMLYSHEGQHNPKLARAEKRRRKKEKGKRGAVPMESEDYDFDQDW